MSTHKIGFYEEFLSHSFIVVPLHSHFLHAIKEIYNFTYLLISLSLIMPPILKKWGTYWFRLVCMCVFVCIHVRDIVLKLHVWIPHGKIADAYFWFSLNYLPLLNYGPLTNKGMKFCKCRISKSIIARNLKLVMLMGDDD